MKHHRSILALLFVGSIALLGAAPMIALSGCWNSRAMFAM